MEGRFEQMTLEAIKAAIADLPEDAKRELASWLNRETMDEWDREMASDFSPGGRGYHVVEKVKAEIRAGKSRPMSEGKPRADE